MGSGVGLSPTNFELHHDVDLICFGLAGVGAQNEIVSAIQDVRKKVHPGRLASSLELSPEISALQNR